MSAASQRTSNMTLIPSKRMASDVAATIVFTLLQSTYEQVKNNGVCTCPMQKHKIT